MIEPLPTTEGGWACILADPPWRFRTYDGKKTTRSVENHYPTMALADIKAMPVREVAARSCWLFLWTTPPFLALSFGVMTAWGFRYSSTAFVWGKLKPSARDALFLGDDDFALGTGHTTRKQVEICLLGRRGSPRRLSRSVGELIVAPRREHSRKPEDTHPRIEAFCAGPRLELFSRTEKPGWTTWGNQTGKFAVAAE